VQVIENEITAGGNRMSLLSLIRIDVLRLPAQASRIVVVYWPSSYLRRNEIVAAHKNF